ncbi:MAG: glycoside hydrolase family 127 protein [Phycisphaerales bacterium]|nr:glycoside hydrolase family 127 protein [Phycisphaerales bacterium]
MRISHRIVTAVFTLMLLTAIASGQVAPIRGLREVPNQQVKLQGGFWGPRLETTHKTTVPHALDCLEKDGHVTNFDKAATGEGLPSGHGAFDSDLYKALEGAMYCLQNKPDKAMSKRVDAILDRILAAQQKDGFLIAYFILKEQQYRWERLRTMHQMYNAGHYFEMAVEHHKVTGDKKVLESARRFADHIGSIFGEGKRYDVDGHQEVELALIKLYRHTGEKRYFDLAKFFLDERGHAHGTERKPYDLRTPVKTPPYEKDLPERAKRLRAKVRQRNGRAQDHRPIIDEKRAVGHAVRAGYQYAAMADLVRFSDAPEYDKVLGHLWEDVVARKMYITGSVGTAQYGDEGFGDAYLLPNRTYCESCANIANVLWQYRMALLKSDAKYADVMELALYNGAISGITLAGNGFSYQNPLESKGGHRRTWIGLSCCPTNLTRIIPQVGSMAYACDDKNKSLYVNLYLAGDASIKLGDTKMKIAQKTDYPWSGKVQLTVTPKTASDFTLRLRIPGWAQGRPVPSDLYHFGNAAVSKVTLKVNGKSADATPGTDGYAVLKRTWKPGDIVELNIPMIARRVYAHEKVKADTGKTSIMRGPLVYCIEAVDNPDTNIPGVILPPKAELKSKHRADLLGGVTVITSEATAGGAPFKMTAIPYYAWNNRDKGAMTVWINEAAPVKAKK